MTGGAGFLGSHVARCCLSLGHEVVVLDDLSGGFVENVPAGVSFVQGSVADEALVSRLFADAPFDYVYHFAAYAAEGLSHFIRRYNYSNNVIGSVTLVNHAVRHRVRRFVYASSIAVYGEAQPPMREDQTPTPSDPYGIAKYAVELDLRCAHEMFGLDSIVFRLHNVYGEHQNIGDPYRNVIGIFMNQVMQGRPMTLFGDGLQTRAFSHVDDCAPAIAGSVDAPAARNEVFNLGADRACTVLEAGETVARAFGVEPRFERHPPRQEAVHAWASHEKASRILGAHSTITLEEGIARMSAWAKRVGPRSTPPFARLEIEEGLPARWQALL